MGIKQQVEKYRASFSLEEVNELIDCIEVACPNGFTSELSILQSIYKRLKTQALLSDAGLANPAYVTKGRQSLNERLGFSDDVETAPSNANNGISRNRKNKEPQTEEERQAFFEAEFAKIDAVSKEAMRKLEAGEKLPLLDNLLLDPAFNFNKD